MENNESCAFIAAAMITVLKSQSASDELFKEKLNGDIYEDNVGITRFLLCELAEKHTTKETFRDLWEKEEQGKNGKKVYVWTIEHIFPERENIPSDWVNMIADGKKPSGQLKILTIEPKNGI